MKRFALLIATVGIAVTLNACCCGDEFQKGFDEGFNGSLTDEFRAMKTLIDGVDASPEKDKVSKLIDKGIVETEEGKFGGLASAAKVGVLRETFNQAIADNKIDKKEAKEFKKLYKDAKKK